MLLLVILAVLDVRKRLGYERKYLYYLAGVWESLNPKDYGTKHLLLSNYLWER